MEQGHSNHNHNYKCPQCGVRDFPALVKVVWNFLLFPVIVTTIYSFLMSNVLGLR